MQVFCITHERAWSEEKDEYFMNKFAALISITVIGRSNAADPFRKPHYTLYDAWKELSAACRVNVSCC